MIEHAGAVTSYGVELYAEGDTLAIRVQQPGMTSLVLYEPRLEAGRIVVTAGLASSGSAGERVYCFDVAHLTPPEDWEEHVVWREPRGDTREASTTRGEAARAVIAECASD